MEEKKQIQEKAELKFKEWIEEKRKLELVMMIVP